MALLWEDISICPLLCQFQLPCHSQVELSSLNSLKVWEEGKNLHNDIAFLLVQVEDAMGNRYYGLSIIWANPSQVKVASMEEAVGKLTACTSSGTNWLYALVQLHEGTCHAPTPKEEHWASYFREGPRQSPVGRSANLRSANSLSPAPKFSTP